jgi:hypothetical protein
MRLACRRLAAPVLLLVSLSAAIAAPAENHPRTMPMHDVDITYRINRDGETLQERTRWRVAARLQRVDPPGSGVYMIMDQGSRHVSLIDASRHAIIDMPSPPPGPLDPDSNAAFTFRGHDTVASLSCDQWETVNFGADTVLCFTADGVLLRVQSAGQTLAEAISVDYTPSDPLVFQVPEGYRHVTPPAGKN